MREVSCPFMARLLRRFARALRQLVSVQPFEVSRCPSCFSDFGLRPSFDLRSSDFGVRWNFVSGALSACRLLAALLAAAAALTGCTSVPRPGTLVPRRGDEIVVAGRF